MAAIIFEGSGVLASSYIGFIDKMYEKISDKTFKYFIGSSAGAMFATFMALGASPAYIAQKFADTKISDFARGQPWYRGGYLGDIVHLVAKKGLYSGDFLTRWIDLCIEELGPIRTFGELYAQRGVVLALPGTNLATSGPEYFSHKTRPDMPIGLALRISGSLTGVFPPVYYDGHFWTDGGLSDNFPIDVVKILAEEPYESIPIVGVHIVTEFEQQRRVYGFLSFIRAVFDAMLNSGHSREYLATIPQFHTANIYTHGIVGSDFSITNEQFNALVAAGAKAAEGFDWQKIVDFNTRGKVTK